MLWPLGEMSADRAAQLIFEKRDYWAWVPKSPHVHVSTFTQRVFWISRIRAN